MRLLFKRALIALTRRWATKLVCAEILVVQHACYLTDDTFINAVRVVSEAPSMVNALHGVRPTKYGYMPDWDVSRVTNISRAFQHRYTFNADISRWNLSAVTDISWLFNDARAFNQDISGWDVSRVQHMQHAFEMASAFNFDISEERFFSD